ncbi:aminopeptidase P family protein [candidate division KSB1 bacterium]|nr:aminopeptidase P family protein [candidate division KSB1 bacterium]
MFDKQIYANRRQILKQQIQSGLLLFPGNAESPMNYNANTYHFRQDSSFLYYFGLDTPGLYALIDTDTGEEIIFGNDFTIDDIVWMGPQSTLSEKAAMVGVSQASDLEAFEKTIVEAIHQNRPVHYLPQYRHDNIIRMEQLTGISTAKVNQRASEELIMAVVAQRLIKSDEEIAEIEQALDISYDMNMLAMKQSRPGMFEYEIYGQIEGLVLSRGSYVSFPVIFTTRGEVLHGHLHDKEMKDGNLLVLDSGAESLRHYASDITRTFPVNGHFTPEQRDIYQIVLDAKEKASTMMAPGVSFREVHLEAAHVIVDGLKQFGFMKGDTDEAVEAGAHALFFPHGLGHPLGLDVHDMEGLGETYVGYGKDVQRSHQFGTAFLRFAKLLEAGHVMTVEPGIYFMPELIAQWKTKNLHPDFINYEKAEEFIGFGGIRIEDDVLVTASGYRVLGKPIPKTVEDVEAACQ